MSSCAKVPSFVSLAQQFTNSVDPMFKKFPPLARAVSAAHHRLRQCHLLTYGGDRPTKFETYLSTGLA